MSFKLKFTKSLIPKVKENRPLNIPRVFFYTSIMTGMTTPLRPYCLRDYVLYKQCRLRGARTRHLKPSNIT